MNKLKVIIPIFIIIIISVGIIITNSNQDTTSKSEIDLTTEESWAYSGPFGIEKTEYNLGEKIFISVENIPMGDKGKAIILRPFNDTHSKEYLSIEFDGNMKNNFNRYFEPRLNEWKSICSVNDLTGNWKIIFAGVEYEELNFRIINQTSSWDDRIMEPIVGKANC